MPDATETPTPAEARRLPPQDFELKEITLHGHRVAYRSAGSGPAIVLVHGITSTSATWDRVMPYLAARFTVIAPDLLGHGQSAKPRGDYSLGAYASGVRDLMVTLGQESATFVGHSLGGGVAMQLAYQFPERCERLVLVDSGGLGREVNLLLRAATLPLSEVVLPLLANARLLEAGRAVGRAFGRPPLRSTVRRAGRQGDERRISNPTGGFELLQRLRTRRLGDVELVVTPLWPTRTPGPRSCTRSARSWSPGANESTPATGCIWPRTSRSCSSGETAIRSFRSSTA